MQRTVITKADEVREQAAAYQAFVNDMKYWQVKMRKTGYIFGRLPEISDEKLLQAIKGNRGLRWIGVKNTLTPEEGARMGNLLGKIYQGSHLHSFSFHDVSKHIAGDLFQSLAKTSCTEMSLVALNNEALIKIFEGVCNCQHQIGTIFLAKTPRPYLGMIAKVLNKNKFKQKLVLRFGDKSFKPKDISYMYKQIKDMKNIILQVSSENGWQDYVPEHAAISRRDDREAKESATDSVRVYRKRVREYHQLAPSESDVTMATSDSDLKANAARRKAKDTESSSPKSPKRARYVTAPETGSDSRPKVPVASTPDSDVPMQALAAESRAKAIGFLDSEFPQATFGMFGVSQRQDPEVKCDYLIPMPPAVPQLSEEQLENLKLKYDGLVNERNAKVAIFKDIKRKNQIKLESIAQLEREIRYLKSEFNMLKKRISPHAPEEYSIPAQNLAPKPNKEVTASRKCTDFENYTNLCEKEEKNIASITAQIEELNEKIAKKEILIRLKFEKEEVERRIEMLSMMLPSLDRNVHGGKGAGFFANASSGSGSDSKSTSTVSQRYVPPR